MESTFHRAPPLARRAQVSVSNEIHASPKVVGGNTRQKSTATHQHDDTRARTKKASLKQAAPSRTDMNMRAPVARERQAAPSSPE
jgi:hypothetical protein